MTHRGATGSDERDGDGAGVMSAIPHELFSVAAQEEHGLQLPPPGQYAAGNIYLNPDERIRSDCKSTFEKLAVSFISLSVPIVISYLSQYLLLFDLSLTTHCYFISLSTYCYFISLSVPIVV
jgi:hypothetical protein